MNNKDLKNKSGIYEIWLQGYVYVGSSKDIYKRIDHHKFQLRANQHTNGDLQDIFNLLGEEKVNVVLFKETDNLIESRKTKNFRIKKRFRSIEC